MSVGGFANAGQAMTAWNEGKEQWHITRKEMAMKVLENQIENEQIENRIKELKGAQKAKYAASGVKGTEGSAADVVLTTEREGYRQLGIKKAFDVMNLAMMRSAGRLAKRAGGMAAMGAFFSSIGNAAYSTYSALSNRNSGGQNKSGSNPGANEGDYGTSDVYSPYYSGGGGGWSLLGGGGGYSGGGIGWSY